MTEDPSVPDSTEFGTTKTMTISNGITILTPEKGKWVSQENKLFSERMIPVRIGCDESEIEGIIDMTMDYYEQEAVMAYVLSENVIIKNRKKSLKKISNPTSEHLLVKALGSS